MWPRRNDRGRSTCGQATRRHAIRPRTRSTQWGPRRRACTAKTKDRPQNTHSSEPLTDHRPTTDRSPKAPQPPRPVCPLGTAAPAITRLPLAAGTMVTGTLARGRRVLWRSAGSGPPPLRYAARIPTRPRRLASLACTRCRQTQQGGGRGADLPPLRRCGAVCIYMYSWEVRILRGTGGGGGG
jgi:hypothetical protein